MKGVDHFLGLRFGGGGCGVEGVGAGGSAPAGAGKLPFTVSKETTGIVGPLRAVAGEYELRVEDAAPEGGSVERGADGRVMIHYPAGYVGKKYRAGDAAGVDLRVVTR